jgi:hypothetical protein
MVSSTLWTEYHFTGLALILGGLLFSVGAFMPLRDKKGALIYGLPPREWLNVIFDHLRLWRYSYWTWWINQFPSANPLRAGFFIMVPIEEASFSWKEAPSDFFC